MSTKEEAGLLPSCITLYVLRVTLPVHLYVAIIIEPHDDDLPALAIIYDILYGPASYIAIATPCSDYSLAIYIL